MSRQTPDIARIISLIMENPKLIEEISKMTRDDSGGDAAPQEAKPEASDHNNAIETVATVTPITESRSRGRNRGELLCALKPYVSKERAQAIDSMLSIVEILDVMKGGK